MHHAAEPQLPPSSTNDLLAVVTLDPRRGCGGVMQCGADDSQMVKHTTIIIIITNCAISSHSICTGRRVHACTSPRSFRLLPTRITGCGRHVFTLQLTAKSGRERYLYLCLYFQSIDRCCQKVKYLPCGYGYGYGYASIVEDGTKSTFQSNLEKLYARKAACHLISWNADTLLSRVPISV